MYANVCALSLFLTCGPYAPLPAWAGENSPECLISLNKRHEELCQVLPAPCQSLLGFFPRRRPRLWFAPQQIPVAALLAAGRRWWHCTVSTNRGQECYAAWNKRTSSTATCTPSGRVCLGRCRRREAEAQSRDQDQWKSKYYTNTSWDAAQSRTHQDNTNQGRLWRLHTKNMNLNASQRMQPITSRELAS